MTLAISHCAAEPGNIGVPARKTQLITAGDLSCQVLRTHLVSWRCPLRMAWDRSYWTNQRTCGRVLLRVDGAAAPSGPRLFR
jgi:hypothetical protein